MGLLTVGMMTSGFGIFMLVLVGADLLLDRDRRRLALAMFIPGLVYVAWYLVYGRSGVATARDPFTVDAVLGVPGFLFEGVGTAFGSVLGIGTQLGTVAAVALAAGIVIQLVRRRPVPSRTIACFGAIVFMYALLGLLRAQLFEGAAAYSRYAYLSGIFAMLGLLALVGPRSMPESRGWRLAAFGGLVAVATLALVWNALAAHRRAGDLRGTGGLHAGGGDGGSRRPAGGRGPGPGELLDRTVTRLREVLAEFGSPVQDSLAGSAVPAVDETLVEAVRRDLLAQQAGS